MTPLASALAKQLVTRPKDREHAWADPQNLKRLRAELDDIHCFEVTQCLGLERELVDMVKQQPREKRWELYQTYTFLPAPKTWIEWLWAPNQRLALLLEQMPRTAAPAHLPGQKARCTLFSQEVATDVGEISTSGHFLVYGGRRGYPKFLREAGETLGNNFEPHFLMFAHNILVLLNTPRIIGRRQHMPHAGLERRLVRGLGAGKFPLHAWTEILLEVAKPVEIDDGEPHEAHLTGRRALHFCRKHIRIRLGQLEYVSAHWRGDPALGIKRARYTVTPGERDG